LAASNVDIPAGIVSLGGKTVRTDAGASAIAGPFVSKANARGVRAQVRLIDQGSHGWPLVLRHGDTLIVDEFADLWWARPVQGSDYRVVRACWPEESATLIGEIRSAFERILA
jgi:hypothetical protein